MEGDVMLGHQAMSQAVGMRELMTVLAFVIVGLFAALGFLSRLLINRLMEQLQEQFRAQNTRLEALERRSDDMEERLRRAASHEDIVRLHGRIDTVNTTLSELKGSITAGGHVLTIIHEYLLNNKGGN
jgi:cell division protein FtsB